MERYVFVHGSSVGQSAFLPDGVPEAICSDIACKYFQGRTLRQKESAAKKALFVDVYHSFQGIYTVYSYVNNVCSGSDGREGQYFAISVLCKDVYVYPEPLYRMLSSAYSQMSQSGKILTDYNNGETQYVISQLSEQKDYLTAFLKKVEEAFDVLARGGVLGLANPQPANYDSWVGYKACLELCNSAASYGQLMSMGRVYISEEYKSVTERIDGLSAQIYKLEADKVQIEQRYIAAQQESSAKASKEIESLKAQIQQRDAMVHTMKAQNADYQAKLDAVRKQLSKYENVGQKIEETSKSFIGKPKSLADLIKWCLLVLTFLLALLSALANFGFFRDNSPLPKKEQPGEVKQVGGSSGQEAEESATLDFDEPSVTTLKVGKELLDFLIVGGTQTIDIETDGNWTPKLSADVQWVKATKISPTELKVTVNYNDSKSLRTTDLMIVAGELEKQIKISQTCSDN